MAGKEKAVIELEAASGEGDFWLDQAAAQSAMRRLSELKADVTLWRGLERQVAEQLGLLEMAQAEADQGIAAEITVEAAKLGKELDGLEFQLMLGGRYDRKGALLALHAGAGGTESQDWTEMLLRMYLRWGERRGYKTEILDTMPGEEAGIKSVTVSLTGPYAYGYLRSERGVHRLVRLSPFDAAHRRHTSFALVEVMPAVDTELEVQVNPEDVKMEVFRSSGAGGQNVQKTSTAVRLIHVPTGIVVTCQDQRSQLQNKETAMRILQARLLAIKVEEQEAEQARLKGHHVDAGWGNQIRSYVLHPYNMVKDHRTEHETSNTAAVLDGEIDEFIQ
ncbi:MAG: peptide chain release factor 2, partial [Chloroflexota bacterium]|nr:peptide chain release factor 2 [Chloroflexota bacterium]